MFFHEFNVKTIFVKFGSEVVGATIGSKVVGAKVINRFSTSLQGFKGSPFLGCEGGGGGKKVAPNRLKLIYVVEQSVLS